jgi:mono/diheme cytochrome c family protein
MRFVYGLVALCVIGIAAGWALTAPAALPEGYAEGHVPDPEAGARIFYAAGCASCHVAPEAEASESPVLAGGQAFPSDFGTFRAPNISPHPAAGIGSWSLEEFARAVTLGVSPEGQHYYPAFPYTAYVNMDPGDVANLFAFMMTLPQSDTASMAHEVGFPFSIRRSVGGWKLLFFDEGFTVTGDLAPEVARGRYLVEAMGHCAECHTPRGALGALERGQWMMGAANPTGKGRIPAIHPSELGWSAGDIAYYLETGFTPDFDSAGGHMADVIRNTARLPAEDRQAIAAYLTALP